MDIHMIIKQIFKHPNDNKTNIKHPNDKTINI